jgi:hypothetical protein
MPIRITSVLNETVEDVIESKWSSCMVHIRQPVMHKKGER